MTTLFVTGLEFYAYHGVPAEERIIGHRYIANVELAVDSSAEQTDDVVDTVDYGLIAFALLEVASSAQYKTVERLAQVSVETLFERFPKIAHIRLRLAKRLPPAPIIAEELGVELSLSRPV